MKRRYCLKMEREDRIIWIAVVITMMVMIGFVVGAMIVNQHLLIQNYRIILIDVWKNLEVENALGTKLLIINVF